MRHLLLILLCLPVWAAASTGPGIPRPTPVLAGLDLDALVQQALASQDDQLLSAPPSPAEQLAIQAAFAAPTAISDRGDDLRQVAALSDSLSAEIAKIRGTLDMIRDGARQIENLTEAALESLPLGLHQRVGNIDIHLAIAEARFTATQAEVDIYLGLDLPNTTQDPIFIARGVGWSRTGGFTADINLELVADWGIDFNSGRSRLILRKTEGGRDGTFVTVDCNGFVAGRLEATVLLSRDWVIPVQNQVVQTNSQLGADSTNLRIEDRVHADFTIDLTRGEGFLVETNLEQPFVFKNKPDVEITVGTFAVDLSDAANPDDLLFPDNYSSPHVIDGFAEPTWQGFYLRALEVRLPEQYTEDPGRPLTIGAPYLIVDRSGFTGHFFADNLLPLGTKSADGWAFSVDTFDLKITQNTFESARIIGAINVPLLAGAADACYVTLDDNAPPGPVRRADCLGYSAYIGPNHLAFSVRTSTQYCVNLWKADLVVEPNSRVDLSYSNGQFDASATINGTLLIDAEVSPGVRFSMDSLSFDDLTLSNRNPHFSPGVWDFPRSITAELKSFELGFTHIGLAVDTLAGDGTRAAALSFNAHLNVDGEFNLNCKGMFKLTGVLKESEERQQWQFRKLRVKAFHIDASTDSWGVKATIAFYEQDPAWGTGFYGAGKLRVSALGGSEIAAVAQFGTFPNDVGGEEKYFFVDVMAKFGNGITLPGGIKLMGIGGGLYKNMTRATPIGQSFANPNDTNITLAKNGVQQAGLTESPLDDFLGMSTSGVQYRVDLGNKFGAFLQVIIAGENEEAFSVNARLELEVRDDGGWRAALDGNVTIMGPVNFNNDPKVTEGVGIFIHMSYVRSETYSGFKATADVFVNIKDETVAGGLQDSVTPPSDTARQERLEFVAEGMGYAGNISLEFSNQVWYIHIGYPKFDSSPMDKRIALAMRIGETDIGVASYFCVGQEVPPIPPLPRRVRALTGEMDMSRDFAQYESAAGFAFGSEMSLVSNGLYGIIYFNMEAGLGFDINVRNYGDAICAGDDPNGEGIGVNGWYAAGQAYAYIDADLGIQTPWWLGNIRVSILKAGVAAVLQVKAPNPVWGRGVIAGYYNVCGGILKGRFRVEGEFGDNCVLTGRDGGDPFASIDVIATMLPDSAATDIATSTEMQGYLVMNLEEVNEIGDREYRVRLVRAELTEADSGNEVDGFLFAGNGDSFFKLRPKEYLQGNTDYVFTAEVTVQGRNVGASSWESELVKREVKAYPFRTGEEPNAITAANVEYSYPVAGMANFYRDEWDEGYLKVKRIQENLTTDLTAVYRLKSGYEYTAAVNWEEGNRTYRWDHPDIAKNKVYQFALVQNYEPPVVDAGGGNNGGNNQNGNPGTNPGNGNDQQQQNDQNLGPGAGGNGLPDGGPSPFWRPDPAPLFNTLHPAAAPSLLLDSTTTTNVNNEVYAFYFRASRHLTFADKLAATFDSQQLVGGNTGPNLVFTNAEPFDSLETQGGIVLEEPLVQMRVKSGENFLNRGIKELIFDNLKFDCPSDFRDYEKWDDIDPEIPYGAVSFVAQFPAAGESDFQRGNMRLTREGGSFIVGFPDAAARIAMEVSGAAEVTLFTMLDELINDYLNSEPDGNVNVPQGPYAFCFPTLPALFADTDPNYDGELETFFYARQLMEEIDDGLICEMPEALLEMYSLRQSLNLTDYSNTSYPVEFRYRLPHGHRQPAINYTFDYN